MSARILHLLVPSAAEPSFPWGSPPEPSPGSRSQPLPSPYSGLHPVPPASIAEARSLRDALAGLIRRERGAAADFLVALADFDARRGWAALGHQSLFAFLSRELRCSDGAAFVRVSAARLIPRYPAVEAALREGQLCLSTAGSLAGILKPENQAELLPKFFGLSARQAKALVATLAPREDPPRREVLSRLPQNPLRTSEADRRGRGAGDGLAMVQAGQAGQAGQVGPGEGGERLASTLTPTSTSPSKPAPVEVLPLPSGERAEVRGAAAPTTVPPSTIQPLSAELHRLHLTVSSRFVKKLAAAKDGLAHAIPGATTEQVLEAALDQLLAKQAARRGLVKRPRTATGAPAAKAVGTQAAAAGLADTAGGTTGGPCAQGTPPGAAPVPPVAANSASPRLGPPAAHTRYIPAAVRRQVWLRDGQRCQYPLDAGGTCGATARLELDHIVPLVLGGPSTAANLRVVCAFHNRAVAKEILGEALVEDRRSRGRRRRAGQPR